MDDIVNVLLLCGEGDKVELKYTEEVNSARRWKTLHPYSRLEERHLVHDIDLTLRNIQGDSDEVDKGDSIRARLTSQLLESFNENALKTFLVFIFRLFKHNSQRLPVHHV